jgi:hypothetical protein
MRAGNPWQIITDRDVLRQETFIVLTREERNGERFVVSPMDIEPMPPASTVIEPTWTGSHEDVEALMQAFLDAAWAMGLRPKGYEGPNELKAVNRHLDDMRRIALYAIGAAEKL